MQGPNTEEEVPQINYQPPNLTAGEYVTTAYWSPFSPQQPP